MNIEIIIEIFKKLPRELVVLVIAGLPISELRGAIPLGLFWGFSPLKTLFLALIGNLIPTIILLLLLQPLSNYLRKIKGWKEFLNWLYSSTEKRATIIQRYSLLGLILFIAIPLPMTGAWTGVIASYVFGLRPKYAIIGLICGVTIAGLIVLSLCLLGFISITLLLK